MTFEADRGVDMRDDPVLSFVVGDRAAAERLDILEVDRRPHRRLGVGQLLARPHDLRLPEAGEKHRHVPLPDSGAPAELAQGLEEVVPVIEADAECPSNRELVAPHLSLSLPCLLLLAWLTAGDG